MTVPDAVLLFAMARGHARIHIEHDAPGRTAAVHRVNPLARKISKSGEVHGRRKPLRLEAPHLARRSRTALSCFATNNPAQRRIMTQPPSAVHTPLPAKATKNRMGKHPV